MDTVAETKSEPRSGFLRSILFSAQPCQVLGGGGDWTFGVRRLSREQMPPLLTALQDIS